MSKRALAATLIAVAVVASAAVVALTWLDEEPYALELAAQELTFVRFDEGGANESFSLHGDLLAYVTEVRVAGVSVWSAPPAAASSDYVDLLPPDRGCGALNVGLAPAGDGLSRLRLVAHAEPSQRESCNRPWRLFLQLGALSARRVLDGDAAVELLLHNPNAPAHVLGAFKAAAVRSSQLLPLADTRRAPQTLAASLSMAGEIETQLVVEPSGAQGAPAAVLGARLFASPFTDLRFSGYSQRRHRILRHVLPLIALVAGAIGFVVQLLGLFAQEPSPRGRDVDTTAATAQPARKRRSSRGP